ncbi:MAG: hypothetical protein BWY92_01706 [Firmicutes bacterium ADurb.BinA052]|nr:MAG: hypothetical protein BWY92_01706 [Firmicutes bacterium ADurb.BinA052]
MPGTTTGLASPIRYSRSYFIPSPTVDHTKVSEAALVYLGSAVISGTAGAVRSITTCPVALMSLSFPSASSAVTCKWCVPSARGSTW